MSARAKVASRLHMIRKDLHGSRAQAGIVSEREAGNAHEKRCQPATQTVFRTHQLMRVIYLRLVTVRSGVHDPAWTGRVQGS